MFDVAVVKLLACVLVIQPKTDSHDVTVIATVRLEHARDLGRD
jgi:hypothetical protein